MSGNREPKIRPLVAYAIVKNNKLNAYEIYSDKDVVLCEGERLVKVTISCDTKKEKK